MADWGTAAILGLIVLLDGLQRVQPGGLVLHRVFGGPWRPPGPTATTGVAVSWLPPFTTTLVIPAEGGPGESAGDLPDRLAAVRPWLWALRGLGALTLLSLVLGVPAAALHLTAPLFFTALGVVLLFAAITMATAAAAANALDGKGRGGWRWAISFLSPFSAPRAAQALMERATVGIPPLMVARVLLSPDDFGVWVRRRAYDAVTGRTPDGELTRLLDRAMLEAIVAGQPLDTRGATSFCPRCGGLFRQEEGQCVECEVALRPVSHGD